MTVIVGLVDDDGQVWMGGDSAFTNGWDLTISKNPKVFRNGPVVMGGTGYARLLQVLQYKFKVPEHPEGMPVDEYLATVFIDAIRECFKDAGYAQKDKDQEEHPGAFLVGYQGKLAEIDGAYAVTIADAQYDAVGCGQSFALGVLYATDGILPKKRIQMALEAAERFSAGVRGPFHTVQLEAPSEKIAEPEEPAA